ncbi:MAG: hypothetical protein ONB05_11975, partial [candidate division KSB1 bacterium]|nr:hypothetical protein [candidate division KSB1 bacterium]
MGGRASIFLVFGFAYLFSVYQLKMGNVTKRAVENYVEYYSRTRAHEIAVSGMNIAAAKVYSDSSWRSGMTVPFQDGTLKIAFGAEADTFQVLSVGEYEGYVDTVIGYFCYTSTGGNLYTQYTLFTANENGVAWSDGDTVWGPIHTNGVLNHQKKNT